MKQYRDLIARVLEHGRDRTDRTGVGTRSLFGLQTEYDLQAGFPLVTSKFVPFRLVQVELAWMLSGSTNIKTLLEQDCHIWSEWPFERWARKACGVRPDKMTKKQYELWLAVFEDAVTWSDEFAEQWGDLGPVYGAQWRDWRGVDQIERLITGLREQPESRRHILTAWNVDQIEDMALPPCHAFAQFYSYECTGVRYLDCKLYQRSADLFLGVPFNIAQYALLTHYLAALTGHLPGRFIHSLGDAHIYLNHVEAVEEMLRQETHPLPRLEQTVPGLPVSVLDYTLEGYKHGPRIPAPVAV